MAGENKRLRQRAIGGIEWDEPFKAAVSLATAQYKWVQPGSIFGEVILATGASLGTPLGVLQNAPAAGEIARVRVLGKTIIAACVGACNLVHGTFITAGSQGVGIPSVCGMAHGRWAGSSILSTASQTYGEAFISALGLGTCVPGAS